MARLFKLQNTIQPYAWGSHTAIAQLLGQSTPSDNPEAELWMGAHPKASSKVWFQGRWQSLNDLINEDPVTYLGQETIDRFGPQLPFLFKVLAVEQPLSLQAHPSSEMAKIGFARESEEKIPLSAPHRNYKDNQHKPECVCALTLFQALCGFRDIQSIRSILEPLWPAQRGQELDILPMMGNDVDIKMFFIHLMTMEKAHRTSLLSHIVASAHSGAQQDPVYDWIVKLSEAFPDDVGILAPALLNLVELQPGQALFLPSGCMHAYLNGVAIEVMANSDNVLRGGLTPKHVDIQELLKVLDFKSHTVDVLHPLALGDLMSVYPSQAVEFELSVITPQSEKPFHSGHRLNAPEILLCLDGQVNFQWEGSSKGLDIHKGESILVPADIEQYHIYGDATLYMAGINSQLAGK